MERTILCSSYARRSTYAILPTLSLWLRTPVKNLTVLILVRDRTRPFHGGKSAQAPSP